MKNYGKIFKQFRESRGLTLKDVAKNMVYPHHIFLDLKEKILI